MGRVPAAVIAARPAPHRASGWRGEAAFGGSGLRHDADQPQTQNPADHQGAELDLDGCPETRPEAAPAAVRIRRRRRWRWVNRHEDGAHSLPPAAAGGDCQEPKPKRAHATASAVLAKLRRGAPDDTTAAATRKAYGNCQHTRRVGARGGRSDAWGSNRSKTPPLQWSATLCGNDTLNLSILELARELPWIPRSLITACRNTNWRRIFRVRRDASWLSGRRKAHDSSRMMVRQRTTHHHFNLLARRAFHAGAVRHAVGAG